MFFTEKNYKKDSNMKRPTEGEWEEILKEITKINERFDYDKQLRDDYFLGVIIPKLEKLFGIEEFNFQNPKDMMKYCMIEMKVDSAIPLVTTQAILVAIELEVDKIRSRERNKEKGKEREKKEERENRKEKGKPNGNQTGK